jgi:putative transposase
MLKTYSLKHGLDIGKFLYAYSAVLNLMIKDIWDTIEWEEKPIKGKKQKRIIPHYKKDKVIKSILRNRYLENWEYTAHWVDSALKTAYAILDSWKKNYNNGRRKRNCPVVKRPFARIKQTMMKLEGEKLRIGWDSNKVSLDGYSPLTGWITVDLKELHTAHIAYDNKRRRINKIAAKKLRAGKRLKSKYSSREKNRIEQILHKITNRISSMVSKHGFEDLDKKGMFRKKGKWNRELSHTDWKTTVKYMLYKSSVELVDPYHTSKDCSRCGCVNKDLNGVIFRCVNNENIVKGFTQTGAEWKETDELVRSIYDMMKPQFYGVL